MTTYVAILLQLKTRPDCTGEIYIDENALYASIKGTAFNDNIDIERDNYTNGEWSTWYSVTGPQDSAALKNLALLIEKNPDVKTVMLRTSSNNIEPLREAPKPLFKKNPAGPRF